MQLATRFGIRLTVATIAIVAAAAALDSAGIIMPPIDPDAGILERIHQFVSGVLQQVISDAVEKVSSNVSSLG